MQVILDWTVFYTPVGGVYRYFFEIMPRLAETPDIHLSVLYPPGSSVPVPEIPGLKKVSPNLLPPSHQLPGGRLKDWLRDYTPLGRWKRVIDRWSAKSRLGRSPQTVFHSPYYTLPPHRDLPCIATIHDLITEKFPSRDEGAEKLRALKAQTIRSATRLIAVSEQTKRDLCEFFDVSPNKVDVIPHGVNFDHFYARRSSEALARLKTKYQIEAPFLLQVGGRLKHKNYEKLAQAFSESTLKKDYTLFSVGEPWSAEETRLLKRLGIDHRVQLARSVNEEDLSGLYQLATALVYPSLYEGFGLPPLEAMASGLVVAVSRTSSIPEVVGDAGIYFDPEDPSSIAKAMEEATDEKTRETLRARGWERARSFTWERTTALTVEAYRKTLRSKVST